MDIPTYAPQAIDRWTLEQTLTPSPKGGRAAAHDPTFCECIVCGDGREALGLKPLMPLFARRAVPDFYRSRRRR